MMVNPQRIPGKVTGGRYPPLVAANSSRRDVLRYAFGAMVAAIAGPGVLGAPHAAATGGTGRSVNVKDFGAIGDGVANDRAAIHAARDAAGVGGAVVFPKGSYRVEMLSAVATGYKLFSGGLQANVAGQTWLLGSAELVLIGSQQDNLITISAPNVSIVGGTLNLSAVTDAYFFNAAIAVFSGTFSGVTWGAFGSGAAGAVIRDVTINDAASYGVWVVRTNSVTVTGCTIKNYYQCGITVETDRDNPTNIFDFLIHGNRLETTFPNAAGIGVGANNQSANNSANFDTSSARVRRARVTNNSVVLPRGIVVPSAGDHGAVEMMNAEDCVIDGNITDGGCMGITTGLLKRTAISNNKCSGWWGIGIEVSGGLKNVTVIGNVLDSDGAGGPFDATTGAQSAGGALNQTIAGILSAGPKTFSDYTIVGNTITGFTTAARAGGIGLVNTLRPSTGGTFANVAIRSNTITAGGGSAKFSAISASAPTTNLTITGNVIDGSSRTPSTGVEIGESTHNGMSITGNSFRNCSVAAFSPYALTPGVFADSTFAGNRVQNCGAVIKAALPS